ncbi:GMC oxidoreductase-domain-containing protein [Boletus edulis BED1]|uniref:GMC oxidoreductase-domain-containing protein n=1 Tax=Boletus edulis BED1 TaxID=1328754 RepID=A0AAD4BX20_BOLED|nr:GMC oxidoreductase-domain-containing protein [Boletus edulis BED1]
MRSAHQTPGGTTACVVAGRLAAADPSLKILIVESGQHSRDLPCHVQPCRFIGNLAPNSTTVSFNVAKTSPHLNGRAAVVPCGRSLGGGSTVNFMLYVRGAASDYDDWERFSNKGWSFNELLPLIKKIETFTPISDRPTHGYSGPIQISASRTDFGFGDQFLDVARTYDQARPVVDDINDFKTANAYVDPVTGKRSDAASRYLYPHSNNPNITILVGKRVKRVIIENGRAIGVEYTTDAISCPGASGELVTVKASKLVVVSAGAFGSPSILERSGIGSPSVLEKHDIRVLVDLPGVGENYQDHLGTSPAFYASHETETMDDVWSDPKALTAQLKEWEENGTGKIAHKFVTVAIEAAVKVRLTGEQLASHGPALRSRWETFFQHRPDKPMAMIVPFSGFPSDPSCSGSLGRKLICAIYYLMYPESIGSVHITSGEDANSPALQLPCCGDFIHVITSPGDVALLTLLYKMTRELTRRMPMYRGDVLASHPNFPQGSPAACTEMNVPVPTDAPDIVYTAADNEAIEKFNRDKGKSSLLDYYSLGTCAMKPRDQGGVVDARLNVYGVQGLKVADLSICPANVGNNTYSTALLVGEKAAVIIAEDLGVKNI